MLIQPGKLHFTEYLKQLPPAWVLNHFFSGDASSRRILSSDMVEESARRFATPEGLQQRFKRLEKSDRLRCAQMYLLGQTGISSEADNGLEDPLVTAFLGFAGRDQRGQLRIFGFEDFIPMLESVITATLAGSSVPGEQFQSASAPVWSWRSCNDITLVASLGSQHLLVRKRSGTLGMSAIHTIKKLIHAVDLHRIEDSDRIANLLIEYCLFHHLLTEQEQEYVLCAARFGEWLDELPIDRRRNEIEAYMVRQSGGWNMGLFSRMLASADRQWFTSSSFSPADQVQVRTALPALQFSGFLEVWKHGTALFFRKAEELQEEDTGKKSVMIMPDFSVILPETCVPETLFTFARFGRVRSLDRVYHGSIDKKVLVEALSAGMGSDEIVAALEKWEAPVNVRESVREWIREFHRISLLAGPVLLTAEGQVTAQIEAYAPLRPYLERMTAHAVFRIRPGSERTVREMMRKMGFDERIPPDQYLEREYRRDEVFSVEEESARWMLVTESESSSAKPAAAIRGTKYGAELKALELSETVQVIDYAILTSQQLVFSYEGSPYVRKGVYTVTPVMCGKGAEPLLDGEMQRTGVRKQFYVKKISAIGVIPQ